MSLELFTIQESEVESLLAEYSVDEIQLMLQSKTFNSGVYNKIVRPYYKKRLLALCKPK